MRAAAERAFRDAMQSHIKDISERYILAGETADAALMFLPSEAVYAELHANFQTVVDASYRARVFIVSPTTLWATLNTVRAILKDVRMKEHAGLIQKEVEALLGDVVRLDDRDAAPAGQLDVTGQQATRLPQPQQFLVANIGVEGVVPQQPQPACQPPQHCVANVVHGWPRRGLL